MLQFNTDKKGRNVSDKDRLINAIERYGVLRLNSEHVSLSRSDFEDVKNRYVDGLLDVNSNFEGDTIYTFHSFSHVECNKVHLYTTGCTIHREKMEPDIYSANVQRVLNGLDWL